jgi:hypothetical protein
MKSSIVKAVLGAAGSLLLASSGFAAIVTTGSITIPNSEDAADPGGISFPVPEFNPALGTLTDVRLDFTSNLMAQVDILNTTGTPQTVTDASSSGTVTFAGPDETEVSGTPSTSFASGIANAGPFVVTDFPGAAIPLSDVVDVLPGGDLSDYEGVGNASFTVTFSPVTSAASGTPGAIDVGGELFATGGSVDVTYTYTPVPEPTSAAIIGVPLMALIARRRRKA